MRRPRRRRSRWALILAGCLAGGVAAAQTTLDLTAEGDTSLFEEGALSNGVGAHLFAGTTALGARRRGLLRFDLSALPAGATIERAELVLSMSRTISGTLTVRLHRVLADWGEGRVAAPGQEGTGAPALPGDATWDERSLGAATWANPGGDFEPLESARASVRDVASYAWSSPQMVADVQRWRDDPAANFGWIIVGNEAAGFGTAKRFDSREHPDPGARPRLRVVYTGGAPEPPRPIPALNGLWLLVLAVALLRAGRKRLVDNHRP